MPRDGPLKMERQKPTILLLPTQVARPVRVFGTLDFDLCRRGNAEKDNDNEKKLVGKEIHVFPRAENSLPAHRDTRSGSLSPPVRIDDLTFVRHSECQTTTKSILA